MDKYDNVLSRGGFDSCSEEWNDHYVINRATLELVNRVSALEKSLVFVLQNFKFSGKD